MQLRRDRDSSVQPWAALPANFGGQVNQHSPVTSASERPPKVANDVSQQRWVESPVDSIDQPATNRQLSEKLAANQPEFPPQAGCSERLVSPDFDDPQFNDRDEQVSVSPDRESWLAAVIPFAGRADNALAFLSSLVVHLVLLIVLTCLIITPDMVGKELLLQADMEAGEATELVELSEFEVVIDHQIEDVTPQVNKPDLAIDLASDAVLETKQALAEGPGVAAKLASSSSAAEQLNVIERTGGGASFFGTYASGSEFVFVLDSSKSMKGDRWQYACDELIRSLKQLGPGQNFLVICFDQRSKFLFNKIKYQSPSEEEITVRVRRWLRSIQLGRETKPAHALQVALSLNPDAIFLLSDGELQDRSVQMLRSQNAWKSEERQVPIHTVHLFSMVGKQTLEVIARENGGEFRSVK